MSAPNAVTPSPCRINSSSDIPSPTADSQMCRSASISECARPPHPTVLRQGNRGPCRNRRALASHRVRPLPSLVQDAASCTARYRASRSLMNSRAVRSERDISRVSSAASCVQWANWCAMKWYSHELR